MNIPTEYDLIADSVEMILSTNKVTLPKYYRDITPSVHIPPVGILEECFLEQDDRAFFNPDDVPPDLLSNINVCILSRVPNSERLHTLTWVCTATQRQRRQANRYSKHMVVMFTANLLEGKWSEINSCIYSWIGGKWVDAIGARSTAKIISSHRTWKKDNASTEDDKIKMAISIGLTMRYQYSLILSDEHTKLQARVFCRPDTARFLLRARDVGNESRRKSIIHMVKRHRKIKRKSFLVRQHLRGEYRCRWAGLNVCVLPSAFDAERATGKVTERLNSEGLLRWSK